MKLNHLRDVREKRNESHYKTETYITTNWVFCDWKNVTEDEWRLPAVTFYEAKIVGGGLI